MVAPIRISIIIPAYNEERHLEACLEAIAGLRLAPYEVLVVDNNSTDRTAEVAGRYPFVRCIPERRQGIAWARQTGFDAARGDILARIDADTIVPPDWTERVAGYYQYMVHNRTVFSGRLHFYNFHFPRFFGIIHALIVQHGSRLLVGHYFPCGSNSAFPREAWQTVRPALCQRTDIHEDVDLGIHFAREGYKTRYVWRLSAGVCIHRVAEQHERLWSYITMWPRTYAVHRLRRGLLLWPMIAFLWLGSWLMYAQERLVPIRGRHH